MARPRKKAGSKNPCAKLKIPEKITITGFKIHTKADARLLHDRDRFAEYSPLLMNIAIDPACSSQRAQLAYCHEVVEAAKDIFNLDLEEEEIQAMGILIYQLIYMNQFEK